MIGIGGIDGGIYCVKTKGNGGKFFLDISLWKDLVVLKRTGGVCFVEGWSSGHSTSFC